MTGALANFGRWLLYQRCGDGSVRRCRREWIVLRGKGIARIWRPIGARGLRKSRFLLSVTPRPGRLTGLKGLSLLLGLLWPRVPLPYRTQLS